MILIIISINIYFKKENFSSPNILNSEVYSNIQNICNSEKTSYFNRLNISGQTKIKNKILNTYIYDIIYPIGTFYVQYSNNSFRSLWDSFPEKNSPNELFPGTKWEKKWDKEGVFFRTEGTLSDLDRKGDGIQDWTLKRLYGTMSPIQPNIDGLWGQSGVFSAAMTENIRGDDDKPVTGSWGSGPGIRFYFDSSKQVPSSDNETRVKNMNMLVWKRIS